MNKINDMEELQQYRAIGTIEECRTAVERMKPKKVVRENGFCVCKDKEGKEIYEIKERCPSCGLYGMGSLSRYDWNGCYCPKCGQSIDWSE